MGSKKSDQKGYKELNISGFQICYFKLYFGLENFKNHRNFAVLKY
jgi:hypothetical protein